jgi:hypothetical protein
MTPCEQCATPTTHVSVDGHAWCSVACAHAGRQALILAHWSESSEQPQVICALPQEPTDE